MGAVKSNLCYKFDPVVGIRDRSRQCPSYHDLFQVAKNVHISPYTTGCRVIDIPTATGEISWSSCQRGASDKVRVVLVNSHFCLRAIL